jgi:hypothetical protein
LQEEACPATRQLDDVLGDAPRLVTCEECVWTLRPELPSRLIESLLHEIPIPPIYFGQDADGRLEMIDGRQRLTTLIKFATNSFPLRKLNHMASLNHKYFRDHSTPTGAKLLRAELSCCDDLATPGARAVLEMAHASPRLSPGAPRPSKSLAVRRAKCLSATSHHSTSGSEGKQNKPISPRFSRVVFAGCCVPVTACHCLIA